MFKFCVAMLASAAAAWAQNTLRMDEAVRAHTVGDQFMGAVLVARGDDILFDRAYGWANLEWRVPNTTETKFRVGSITKQFTAAAVLRLAEQGKLSLDDSLAKYVTAAPEAWRPITLRQLLNHTSGVASFTSLPDIAVLLRSPLELEKSIARLCDLPNESAPGEKYRYSNTGYLLLGHVIQRVSGQAYAAFLREQFLQPLGLNDTDHDSDIAIVPFRAGGHTRVNGQLQHAAYINMEVPQAAGALYSTTHDMLRWTRALFGGRVLSPASLTMMITPGLGNYGLGVVVRHVNGRQLIEHAGSIEGFNAHLAHYPQTGITVIVLANVNGNSPTEIAAELGELAHAEGAGGTSTKP